MVVMMARGCTWGGVSEARVAVDKARGETIDRRGDAEANSADHNRRHNTVLNKAYNMMTASAEESLQN